MEQIELIATTTFGLEAVVSREIQKLGYESKILDNGRVLFSGKPEAVCHANLWLRSAERVLLRIGEFEAMDFEDLFEKTKQLPWEKWIAPDATFPVNGKSVKSQLSSVPAVQRCVKKAIVEKLLQAHDVETLPETGPTYTVKVSILKDQVTITFDTSGAGLHKRGYRTLSGPAPIKETLAAAMVQLSFWKPERLLIDPFCGTGTIVIEAAMLACNVAPGLQREFDAESWPQFPKKMWDDARKQAYAKSNPDAPVKLIGYDIDPEVLSLARYHAKRAGVSEYIHFQTQDFLNLHSVRDYGCVITNPPYGHRLGEYEQAVELYEQMPNIFRQLSTWSFYLITAESHFEKIIGQQADRRRKLYNGRIECTYYQFHGTRPPAATNSTDTQNATNAIDTPTPNSIDTPNKPTNKPTNKPSEPNSKLADATESNALANKPNPWATTQAFGGLTKKADEQAEIFSNRLIKRAKHLRRWPTRQGITCYRLYDRDIPEIPLVIDRYEDKLHIGEYTRPHERTTAQHAEWLELMAQTAAKALKVDSKSVFLKKRGRQRGQMQYELVSDSHKIFTVQEAGLKFKVNLSDYVDTGLFLDHRITRSLVRADANQKRLLNLFAYTGSFTVYAAAGGAKTTTTVDWSNTYLDWTYENLKANQLADDRHRLVRADAMNYVQAHAPGEHYDLAVVDPPTFSNSKRTEEIFDVQRDHIELLSNVRKLMSLGGIIYFSTNFKQFKPQLDHIENIDAHEISKQTVPDDFRNKRIHRCWKITCV